MGCFTHGEGAASSPGSPVCLHAPDMGASSMASCLSDDAHTRLLFVANRNIETRSLFPIQKFVRDASRAVADSSQAFGLCRSLRSPREGCSPEVPEDALHSPEQSTTWRGIGGAVVHDALATKRLTVGNKRLRCKEVLLQPSLIYQCDVDIRKDLCAMSCSQAARPFSKGLASA